MWYRYETHMHSREGSACGKDSAADMVRAYHAAGYAGAVLTDHFIWGNTAIPRDLPWEERMQGYYDAYLSAKPLADELDFDLLFGIEHFYGNWKEILIYGLGVDFWKANPDIPQISVEELGERVHAAGGLISHAHPYRFRASYMDAFYEPTLTMCDAIEVFNGGNSSQEENDMALAYAQKHHMPMTGGSDAHHVDETARGYNALEKKAESYAELCEAIRTGKAIVMHK